MLVKALHGISYWLVPHKELIKYLLKFFGLFGLLYFTYLAVFGLSDPRNYYSPFVDTYLNFINPLLRFILLATKGFVSLLGYEPFFKNEYALGLPDGHGVGMAAPCAGCGVMSFWIAFVFANKGPWKQKAAWMIGGCVVIFIINVLRISFLLVAFDKNKPLPFGWDHHDWFNVVAYGFIFLLIYLYGWLEGKKKAATL